MPRALPSGRKVRAPSQSSPNKTTTRSSPHTRRRLDYAESGASDGDDSDSDGNMEGEEEQGVDDIVSADSDELTDEDEQMEGSNDGESESSADDFLLDASPAAGGKGGATSRRAAAASVPGGRGKARTVAERIALRGDVPLGGAPTGRTSSRRAAVLLAQRAASEAGRRGARGGAGRGAFKVRVGGEDDVDVMEEEEEEEEEEGGGGGGEGNVHAPSTLGRQRGGGRGGRRARHVQEEEEEASPPDLGLAWLGQPTHVDAGAGSTPDRVHHASFRLRGVVFVLGDWVEVLAERPDAGGKVVRRLYPARLLGAWQVGGKGEYGAEALVAWAVYAEETGHVEGCGSREVFPTATTEAVPLAAVNGRATLLTPEQWEGRRRRKAQERLVKGAKARVAQAVDLPLLAGSKRGREAMERKSGGGGGGGGGRGGGDGEEDSDDSEWSRESESRTALVDEGQERTVAVYVARYSYDKSTRQFLPFTPQDDRARAAAIMSAVGVGEPLHLIAPPLLKRAVQPKKAAAAAPGSAEREGPPAGLGYVSPVLLSHVVAPQSAVGVASGSGVLIGGGEVGGGGGAPPPPPPRHGKAHSGAAGRVLASGGSGGGGAPLTPTPFGDASALYEAAVKQLRLSSVPPTLPCRESERAAIRETLSSSIKQASQGGGGQALYVSGMPGTGKTACVTEVIRALAVEARGGNLPPFTYVEVNAMKLQNPYALYPALWRAMTAQHVAPAKACSLLEHKFTGMEGGGGAAAGGSGSSRGRGSGGGKRAAAQAALVSDRTCRTVVLVVDELDYLVTRKQSVLYNLFDWPTAPGSGLVVIGIANTMDMPERLLPRVASRLGLGRVVFTPYTPSQIQTIVESRLASLPPGVFDTSAITLASKKVASVSGDIRRALATAREAAKLAWARYERGGSPVFHVTLDDVKVAAAELAADLHAARLAATSPMERLLLLALASHVRTNGGEGATLDVLHNRAVTIVKVYVEGGAGGGGGGGVGGGEGGAGMPTTPPPAQALPLATGGLDEFLGWTKEMDAISEGGGGGGGDPVAADTASLRRAYLPCPTPHALAGVAQRLSESRLVHYVMHTPVGASLAMASGVLTGRGAGGYLLAGVYPSLLLCGGVDEVATALRGDPLVRRMTAAGAL